MSKADRTPARDSIDGRYQVQAVVGRGGTSTVYRVWDAATERVCALKLLQAPEPARAEQMSALFQREYATLQQLTHPGVIRVHDFGIAEDGPYYTMELLEGADLRKLAPLPWREASGVLREVASALSLLHSRRLVHRDVSASNVRYVGGQAKLMDFGAMMDVGAASQLVGTPPYIAPEAINGQLLDGRTDLFALGALAYFTLTGVNAFPASSLADLRALWRASPVPPSHHVAEIPPGLDQLVMSLLSLDARARPGTAAEVIERLTAVAGLGRDRRYETARAYLTAPQLVGREPELEHFYGRLEGAPEEVRGGALMFEGVTGVGKTRVLDACVLEARLSGALVVRVEGQQSLNQDFGLLRALARLLLETAPELAMNVGAEHVGVLAHVVPELELFLQEGGLAELAAQQLHPHVQASAQAWLRAIASDQRLVIAVDDVGAADQASLLVLAELARTAAADELILAVTLNPERELAAPRVVGLLQAACQRVTLTALGLEDSERLLSSLFGDVGMNPQVAGWLHQIAQGVPQVLMELAQHLVDSGGACYENGRWQLAPDLARGTLPRSLTDAYAERIRALGPAARALAEALALSAPHVPLELACYRQLLAGEAPLRVYAALDELVARHVLVARGGGHAFVHGELARVITADISPERACELRRTLAAMELNRGQLLMAAFYLHQAGDESEASLLLRRFVTGEIQTSGQSFLLTPVCARLVESGLRTAEREGATPRERYYLRRSLLLISAYVELDVVAVGDPLLEQLRADTGLAFFDAADTDPRQFVERCLPRAQERYDALPAEERGLAPIDAIRELGHSVVALTGAHGRRIDPVGVRRLADLVAPLRGLSPVVDLLHDVTLLAIDRIGGRTLSGRIDEVLRQLEGPVPGLDEIVRGGARRVLTYYLALEQAQLCSPRVEDYAAMIAEDPVHEPLAWHLRMVKHMYGGNAERAQACRERTEMLALRQPEGYVQLATSVLYETEVHTLCGDLMALKAALPGLERQAELGPGWEPFVLSVRGEYDMLCGLHERACERFEQVLAMVEPGVHTAWCRTMRSYAETLVAMGRHDAAIELSGAARARAAELSLNPLYPVMLRSSTASALAERGDHEQARTEIAGALADAQALGMGGVPLGCIYEAAARIAVRAHKRVEFEVNAEHARLQYTLGGHPQLIGRYQRLTAFGHRALG